MSQRGYFRQLRVIHSAMLFGLVIFTGVIFFIQHRQGSPLAGDLKMERILQVIAVLLSVGCLVLGYRRYNAALVELKKSFGTLAERTNGYRAASVQWWAMLEGPALFGLIGYFLAGNFAFLFLSLFHTAVLAMSIPKRDIIIMLLNLRPDEVAQLED